jgi:hypothetical protein
MIKSHSSHRRHLSQWQSTSESGWRTIFGAAPDRSRVSMEDQHEVRYWTETLGCSKDELAVAVARVASDKECEDYARECAMIAGLTNDREVRDQMLKVGCRWMEAAAHERFALVVGPFAGRQ